MKYLENPIEVERGNSFVLNLIANKAGEDPTQVQQDFRYNVAYIYADWNGDLNFTEDGRVAKVGFTSGEFGANGLNAVKANYDYTLNITKEITVPATAETQSIPLRIAYQNAWDTYPTACSNVLEGMIYDFKLTVLPAASAVSKNRLQSFRVSQKNNIIFCEGDFQAGAKIDLIGMSGLVLHSEKLPFARNNVQFQSGNLPKGVYLVSIQNKGNIEVYKLIK